MPQTTKTLLCLGFFFALASALHAQPIDTLWTKTYWCGNYDSVGNVQETSDHGFIMTTLSVRPGHTDYDISLVKADSLGEMEWTTYIGDAHHEGGMHVLQTFDGGYLVSARSSIVGAGNGGLWIVKTDAAGDTVWTFPYCPDNRGGYPLHAIQLADSSFAITGMINRAATLDDAFILRLDKDGNFIDYDDYGDGHSQEGRFIVQMPDSGFLLAGSFRHTYTTETDWWVVKTNKYLDLLWDSSYVLTSQYDEMNGACVTDDGLVMTGRAANISHALKVDFEGHTVWSKSVSVGSSEERYISVCPTGDGGVMIGGLANVVSYRRNFIFLRLDPNGDTLWSFRVGGDDDDHGRSVIQTYDGNFALAGKSSSWFNGTCTWLVKIGVPECCEERVGDANGLGDYPDEISLGDIMMLVDAKYISENCDKIACLEEADLNQSGGADPTCDDITLVDIMTLVDFLYITGPGSAVLLNCL
jgi:hypothetical protein